jgi:hypothetical protein
MQEIRELVLHDKGQRRERRARSTSNPAVPASPPRGIAS